MIFDSEKNEYSVKGKSLMDNQVLKEIEVLGGLLGVLCNGIIKPNDLTYQIKKIEDLERDLNIDLTEVKKCCPQDNTVREAKDFKPLITKVLHRIDSHF